MDARASWSYDGRAGTQFSSPKMRMQAVYTAHPPIHPPYSQTSEPGGGVQPSAVLDSVAADAVGNATSAVTSPSATTSFLVEVMCQGQSRFNDMACGSLEA